MRQSNLWSKNLLMQENILERMACTSQNFGITHIVINFTEFSNNGKCFDFAVTIDKIETNKEV